MASDQRELAFHFFFLLLKLAGVCIEFKRRTEEAISYWKYADLCHIVMEAVIRKLPFVLYDSVQSVLCGYRILLLNCAALGLLP